MRETSRKPVALLITANTSPPLDCLEEESRAIAYSLESSGLCDVVCVPAATLRDVVTKLNEPDLHDRVVIVHYAGHANGQGIQLAVEDGREKGELAHIRGLADILKQQPNLRLLFINGCSSRAQVLDLSRAGLPLVIATNRGIEDQVARDFAESFYRMLSLRRSVADAYSIAGSEIGHSRVENARELYSDDFVDSRAARDNSPPWEIYGPDTDRRWKLSDPYYRGTGPRWDHTTFDFNEESPYLGLRYFTAADSQCFFGRDDFVEELLAEVDTSPPLLMVIGASGTGKSSVVRAGVIPAWKRQYAGAAAPRAIVLTPEDDPFDQLSIELGRIDEFDRERVRGFRQSSPTALRDACSTFQGDEPWLLFIDQFEQVFTRTTDPIKRKDFLDAIVDLANDRNLNVCLILAMRDDFFAQLRDYPALFPITDKHLHRVAPLNRDALEEVIRRPAAQHGVTFEDGLVQKIIGAIDGQPGALPLLQYALDALWAQESVDERVLCNPTYDDLGGVTGSIAQRFDALYNGLDDTGKDEFRWMMLKLVTYDERTAESCAVSRLAPKSEFTGRQQDFLNALINKEKLLVSSGTETPSVQLGHEKIIEAWPEYTQWTQQHRESNSIRQQLSRAARAWSAIEEEGEDAERALWQGFQLEKALELRKRGDFAQLGGLGPDDNQFLDVSYRQSRKLIHDLYTQIGNASWQQAVLDRDYDHNNVRAAHRFTAAATAFVRAEKYARAANALTAAPDSVKATFPHDGHVHGALFSGDGSRILSWSRDKTVRLWDPDQEGPLRTLRHDGDVNAALFNGDGSRNLSWSYGDVNGALFNGDASRILSWSWDETVRLWDPDEEAPLRTFRHDSDVNGALFSGDGSRILSWSEDKTVRLWDVPSFTNLSTDSMATIKLALEVRTAATINEQGAFQTLKYKEWLEKRNRLYGEK